MVRPDVNFSLWIGNCLTKRPIIYIQNGNCLQYVQLQQINNMNFNVSHCFSFECQDFLEDYEFLKIAYRNSTSFSSNVFSGISQRNLINK